MRDGHLNKCKTCARSDVRIGKIRRACLVCEKPFLAHATEIRRGGGKLCSRSCYYEWQRRTAKKGEDHHSWKGDRVGNAALHDWVRKLLGVPQKCEKCGTDRAKFYDWANKSGLYMRDVSDWIRLCRKCHNRYDYAERTSKLRASVRRRYGWNVGSS